MKPVSLVLAAALAVYLVVRWKRFSVEGRGFLLVVIAGLIVHGTGVVKLPNFEQLIVDLGTSLGSWTYLLVGAMAFAETGAFLGFIAPGEVTVIVGGVVAGQGKIDAVALIALVWACCVAGDMTSYYLGRRLGRGFLEHHGRRVQITPERLDKVEDLFRRRGGLAILVGRFIGFVRPLAPFLAGSMHMPFRRFAAYDVLAAGLWSATFVLLGYVFWHSFAQVTAIAKQGAFALGLAVALGLGVVWAIKHRMELRDRILATRAGRAVAGPVRFAWNRLTPGDLGLELTTLLAVAGVGLFTFVGYMFVLADMVTTPGDVRAFDIAGHLRADAGIDVAKLLTWLGSAPVTWTAIALAAAWLGARGRRLEAIVLVAGMAITFVGVQVTKELMDRPRPGHMLVGADGKSYPSGHSAYAVGWVAIAVALNRAAPRLRRFAIPIVAIAIAIVVGLTRIYLHVHYLSDVLGGAGLAAASFALCAVVALIVDFVRHNEAR